MAVVDINIAPGTQVPEVSIHVGFGLFCKYEFRLEFSEAAARPPLVFKGVNSDTVQDRFALGISTSALHGAVLRWGFVIAAFSSGDQPYVADILISQNHTVMEGGRIEYRGDFNKAINLPDPENEEHVMEVRFSVL